MAEVITRLKLESGEYDSKIKRATQGLLKMEQECRSVNGTLAVLEKEQKDFVKALGSMETVSTSVRGKLGELTAAYTELRVQYNRLTDDEKKGDFGKALSASLDQLKTRINDTKQQLRDVSNELDGIGGKSTNGGLFGGKLDGMLQVFGGNMMTKAVSIASDLASELASCVSEGIELAKAGEGVRLAFDRLNRPDILQGLRDATHGTVTDIELMKAAVKFNDFRLPLDELGTMLAFAQQKAKDTGQSVDYMVDSIVTGLGRQSLMILDNLGLSAAEIKNRMKETGDMTKAVGAIIRDQMSKAGDYVETAADKATAADVRMKNAMEELGRTFQPLAEAGVSMFNRLKLAAIDALNGMRPFFDQFTEAGRIRNQMENRGGMSRVGGEVQKLRVAKASGSSYYTNYSYQQTLRQYDDEIKRIQFTIAANSRDNDAMAKGRIQKLEEELQAVRKLRAEYDKQAKDVLNPKAVTSPAVTAGDTKTSSGTSPREQAEKQVASALLDYQQTIDKASLEMKSGMADELATKKKQLSAQERLYDAYGKAYNTYADPKYKEGQDKAAEEIVRLGKEIKTTADFQKDAQQSAREMEQAQKKLADAYRGINKAMGENDLKGFYAANKQLSAAGGTAMQVPLFSYTEDNLSAFIQNLKEQIGASDVGSELFNKLTAQLADAQLLGDFVSTAIKNGIDASEIDPQGIFSKIFGDGKTAGDYIPDEFWEGLGEQFSEALGKNIDVDTNEGKLKEGKDSEASLNKSIENLSKGISGLSTINAGLQGLGIDLGEDVQNAIDYAKSLMSVIQGVQTIISIFSTGPQAANTAAVSFNTAAVTALTSAIWSNTATSFIPFAHGGTVPHAANGYFIGGNRPSGDKTPILANAGELVLNKAQQGNLASQLTGGGIGDLHLSTEIDAESIKIILNDYGERTNQGEFLRAQFG